MDDDGSKGLNWEEFSKGVHDFRIAQALVEDDLKRLFASFDVNGDGTVNFDEFMRTVHGEMNEFRKELVRSAFKKFDADGSGLVDMHDLRSYYNAREHPDVRKGKKTEDDVLMEFLDTFDMHHRVRYQGQADKKVTLEEFIEYYNNISCLIDDDEYFELMINQAWNLKNRNYSRGWAGY